MLSLLIATQAYSQDFNKLPDRTEGIDIGSRLEIFIDHYLIDTLNNTSLRLHEPIDKGSVLIFDKPWEGPFSAYCTVIKDRNLFRLYYRGLPTAGKDGRTDESTCYAESNDGINWSKPTSTFMR